MEVPSLYTPTRGADNYSMSTGTTMAVAFANIFMAKMENKDRAAWLFLEHKFRWNWEVSDTFVPN